MFTRGDDKEDGDIDEEDRRFFEELSKGFSARAEPQNLEERNEMMDDTRATRQMLAA